MELIPETDTFLLAGLDDASKKDSIFVFSMTTKSVIKRIRSPDEDSGPVKSINNCFAVPLL